MISIARLVAIAALCLACTTILNAQLPTIAVEDPLYWDRVTTDVDGAHLPEDIVADYELTYAPRGEAPGADPELLRVEGTVNDVQSVAVGAWLHDLGVPAGEYTAYARTVGQGLDTSAWSEGLDFLWSPPISQWAAPELRALPEEPVSDDGPDDNESGADPVVGEPAIVGAELTSEFAVGTHRVEVPPGLAGDLLLIVVGLHTAPTTAFPEGWTRIERAVYDGTGGGTTERKTVEVWFRVAAADEQSFTYTTSRDRHSVTICYRIRGWDEALPPRAVASHGFDAAPDPAALAVPWGERPARWIAYTITDARSFDSRPFPEGYTDDLLTFAGSNTGVLAASRALAVGSEDPGAFVLNVEAEEWVALTIAVPGVE